jgi:hypothetical protein
MSGSRNAWYTLAPDNGELILVGIARHRRAHSVVRGQGRRRLGISRIIRSMVSRRGFQVLALSVTILGCGSSKSEHGTEPASGGASSGAGGLGGTSAAGQSGRGGASGSGSAMGGSAGSSAGGGSALGGSSGSSAGSGSSAAGSSAGSAEVGRAEAEACILYAAASCKAQAACRSADSGNGYGCALHCPDALFAPGSTRTAEVVKECAAALATASCEDLANGVYPPCVTPGTRKVGEPCLYSAQCESLACNTDDSGGCGTCARALDPNEDCTGPDTQCPGSHECIEGTCQIHTDVYKDPGEPCTSQVECDYDSYCDGVCKSLPNANESCEGFDACVSGFYCAAADHVCHADPLLNEPCGSSARTDYPRCAVGLGCTVGRGQSGGTCVEMTTVALGDSCEPTRVRCPAGAICACTDASCSARVCGNERLLGESCGEDLNLCNQVLECVAGVCEAHLYRGYYEEACGP